jgi:hypothetical protein
VSLTWPDVERLFGTECMVAFDRDIGPQGWDAVLRVSHGELWALDKRCCERITALADYGLAEDVAHELLCRCVAWSGGQWRSRSDLARRLRIRAQFRRLETEERAAMAIDAVVAAYRDPNHIPWFRYSSPRAGKTMTARTLVLSRILGGERVLLVRPDGDVVIDSVEALDRAWPSTISAARVATDPHRP